MKESGRKRKEIRDEEEGAAEGSREGSEAVFGEVRTAE